MIFFEKISVFLIICVVLCQCNTKNETNSTDEFIPTHEWQVVKKGQAVPKGLHVRINLETGVTEAKLIDTDDKSKSLSVVPEEVSENKTKSEINSRKKRLSTILKDEIEEALKNIPGDTYEPSPNGNFRTLDEIKSEFEDINMDMKTDVEIMKELFSKYEVIKKLLPPNNMLKDKLDLESVNSFISVEMLHILQDMEYLVHQIDNGVEFIKMKGLETMVYPHLNTSDATLKAEAINLMGSCLQNNIKVQIHALETNAGDYLLKILALDKNEFVKAKAVYALGALVRRFPLAQKQVISKHGMDVLTKLLLSDNPAYVKLKLKILSLLEDLVLEHQSVLENHISGDPLEEEKLRQYYQVDLMSKMSSPALCDILSRLLQEYFELDSSNIDNMEKVFSAVNTFSHICKHHHYKDQKLLVLFHKMQTLYGNLLKDKERTPPIENSQDESREFDTEYYKSVLIMIENYINELNHAKVKDEL